jgi:hypothetical protein
MYMLISRQPEIGVPQYHFADGPQHVFDIGLALLDRGDDVIDIFGTKDAFEIDPSQVRTAWLNRVRYAAQGVKYEPLPPLAN